MKSNSLRIVLAWVLTVAFSDLPGQSQTLVQSRNGIKTEPAVGMVEHPTEKRIKYGVNGARENFADVVNDFDAGEWSLLRKYPQRETRAHYRHMIDYYEGWLKQFSDYPFNELGKTEKLDFVLLVKTIENKLYFIRADQREFEELKFVIAPADSLQDFILKRLRGARPDAVALARNYEVVINQLAAAKASITRTPFDSWQKAEKAANIISDFRSALDEAYSFYFGYDPQFSWWVEKPHAQLVKFLKEYTKFLSSHYQNSIVKDDGSGIIGRPIGRGALIESLNTEFINYTPEELIGIAEKEFAWCEKEMLRASAELGTGKDWKKALEKVKNSYVAPGDQPELVNRLAEEAINFLEKNDLITIPPLARENWRMKMLTADQQRVNPFFTGGEEICISYPTTTMTGPERMMSMRGNNPFFSRATVHHELIPGHHLQDYMQQRFKTYRRPFSTPFWIEGWALYWEMNLWDKGFAKSPEERIGMLFWRMHRCARIIFSLNYHLGKMTPKECINFLVDRVGHETANAEAEVRRSFTGGYGPLYQIAYMVGGLQLKALRNEVVTSGLMSEKQFHDRVLQEGSIPIEILRQIILEKDINRTYTTSWKFYN